MLTAPQHCTAPTEDSCNDEPPTTSIKSQPLWSIGMPSESQYHLQPRAGTFSSSFQSRGGDTRASTGSTAHIAVTCRLVLQLYYQPDHKNRDAEWLSLASALQCSPKQRFSPCVTCHMTRHAGHSATRVRHKPMRQGGKPQQPCTTLLIQKRTPGSEGTRLQAQLTLPSLRLSHLQPAKKSTPS